MKHRKVRGNLFVELGFPPEEAAVLKMRADLMGDLREYIRDSGLTQAAVAKRLKIGQSRVSDLVRGKWENARRSGWAQGRLAGCRLTPSGGITGHRGHETPVEPGACAGPGL